MSLWLPNGASMDAYRVDRAVNAYDERLMFARNEDTGDWCVFVRMPSPDPPIPVFGFGDRIPDPVEAVAKVQEGHLARHKERIWREVTESQEAYRKKFRDKGDEATDESVEVIEHFMRQHGKSPIVKVLPKVKKGVSDDDS
jgi:hypothetical protein